MKSGAMVLEKFNEPLVYREIEIPPLEPEEVLVKISAAGVCGSDIHMQKGEDPRIPLPIILGHEGVGTIVDMNGGRKTVDARKLTPGDNIIWNRGISCGRCYYCKIVNDPSLCSNRIVYGITRSSAEKPYLNGCYADYLVLHPKTDIFFRPEAIDPAVLVSASCSGATIAHAFDMVPGNLIGQTVVVQGPGPLGCYAVAFAKRLGAAHIMVIGGSRERLNLCRDFGATHLLNRHDLTAEERSSLIMESTSGRGADLVIEAVGARGVAEEGVGLVRKGGLYLSTGYAQPAGAESIDFYRDVVNKNIRIQGVWVSDTRHMKQALDLVTENPGLFAKLITHTYPLNQLNVAFREMREKRAMKAVIIP